MFVHNKDVTGNFDVSEVYAQCQYLTEVKHYTIIHHCSCYKRECRQDRRTKMLSGNLEMCLDEHSLETYFKNSSSSKTSFP